MKIFKYERAGFDKSDVEEGRGTAQAGEKEAVNIANVEFFKIVPNPALAVNNREKEHSDFPLEATGHSSHAAEDGRRVLLKELFIGLFYNIDGGSDNKISNGTIKDFRKRDSIHELLPIMSAEQVESIGA